MRARRVGGGRWESVWTVVGGGSGFKCQLFGDQVVSFIIQMFNFKVQGSSSHVNGPLFGFQMFILEFKYPLSWFMCSLSELKMFTTRG